ncbi:unnamed protein product [Polarella glacialis]|uniref:Uncharacterized protein n=2 Tax=Polarella glacialis TaxID=89957 RepID=A0A813IGV1_POLGL|nr:unnamed protein product [Polarella glacialis]
MNRDLTNQIITNMAQDQERCIPPHVADAITAHVGDNDLMNGPELRTLEKLWEAFFEQQLKPFAERGEMKVTWNYANDVRRYFQDISDECLFDLFKRKKVAIKKTGSGLSWELSW